MTARRYVGVWDEHDLAGPVTRLNRGTMQGFRG